MVAATIANGRANLSKGLDIAASMNIGRVAFSDALSITHPAPNSPNDMARTHDAAMIIGALNNRILIFHQTSRGFRPNVAATSSC